MKLLVYCGSSFCNTPSWGLTSWGKGSSLQLLKKKKLPEVGFYKEMIELVRKSQIREIRLAAFDTICFNFMPYHFYNQVRKLIKTFAFFSPTGQISRAFGQFLF